MSNPKPTPAQARLLRSLASSDYRREWSQPHLNLWFNGDGRVARVHGNNIGRGRAGNKVRVSTAHVLFANSWLEMTTAPGRTGNYHIISAAGRSVLISLSESDFITLPPSANSYTSIWTTADIRDALESKYRKLNEKGYENSAVWIYFSELGNHSSASRRVDFWAMACWRSLGYQKIAYEIKISRADFLKELRSPTKRQFALSISDQFYFVTPPKLVSLDELPSEAGLIELNETGKLRTVKSAKNRITLFEFDWSFAATLGRSIFRLDGEIETNFLPE